MAQFGKQSSRRNKPSYTYSIIGVAIVLLILGIMGWIFLNVRQMADAAKANIRISAYLRTMNKDSINQIRTFIGSQDFASDVSYVNKESAKQIWNHDNNEDWSKFLDYNPLPESIDFHMKADYVNPDSLQKVSSVIMGAYGNQITDLQYPKNLVSSLNERAGRIGVIFLVVAIVLCIIVIVSIDNTIRLAMFSSRFLIKTMQMVGATRNFIAKPMDIRALINGLISAGIAILILFSLIQWAESQVPELRAIRDTRLTLTLFGGMIVLGVGICLFSTHRAVMKYLRLKLDDLY